MGCSKNYIMYWGVFTVIIVAQEYKKVCTNLTKFEIFFCADCHFTLRDLRLPAQKLPQIPADLTFLL